MRIAHESARHAGWASAALALQRLNLPSHRNNPLLFPSDCAILLTESVHELCLRAHELVVIRQWSTIVSKKI